MMSIITLTTDFGVNDAYVAAMKGVMLTINPEAKLVDITHYIEPQNVRQAAFVLSNACPFFPDGTVHLVVVDPGVGSQRKAVIVKTATAYFVAPDNGVLSYVIGRSGQKPPDIIAITRSEFWRSPVSPTFHGRDVFAPVAARLSLGFPPEDFGETVSSLKVFPIPQPSRASDGSLTGHIIHIDSFGNLVTDIMEKDLPEQKETLIVKVRNRVITGLSTTYTEGEGLLALIGSSGYLEVSRKDGSAAALLHAKVDDKVTLK